MFNELMNSVKDTARGLDPVYNKLNKKTKKMVDILLAEGYEPKEIVKFVDTYSDSIEEYAQKQERKVLKKMMAERNNAA